MDCLFCQMLGPEDQNGAWVIVGLKNNGYWSMNDEPSWPQASRSPAPHTHSWLHNTWDWDGPKGWQGRFYHRRDLLVHSHAPGRAVNHCPLSDQHLDHYHRSGHKTQAGQLLSLHSPTQGLVQEWSLDSLWANQNLPWDFPIRWALFSSAAEFDRQGCSYQLHGENLSL